jgi:hypothetical protein
MIERNSKNPNNTLATLETSAIAERPATGNHQELKERQQQQECLPPSGCKQQQWHKQQQQRQQKATLRMTALSCPLTTAEKQATAGMKVKKQDPQHSMDATRSRDACRNSEAGYSMEGDQQQQRNRNITASTAEGRPITTRLPEIVETSQQQY